MQNYYFFLNQTNLFTTNYAFRGTFLTKYVVKISNST